MKEFQYLTAEQMKEIVDAIRTGRIEWYSEFNGGWRPVNCGLTVLSAIYRVRTPQEDDTPIRGIPWLSVKDKYKWAAMDMSGAVYLYLEKPTLREVMWEGEELIGTDAFKFDLDGVEWNTSLTKRPE